MVFMLLFPGECTGERRNSWCARCREIGKGIGSLLSTKKRLKRINEFNINPWMVCCRSIFLFLCILFSGKP
ncbi:hypothetical protein HMPREF3039_01533 [Akkermansia sp. KLE1798]|nr:hypothetical protein HMPREF3039_01533 [Akkermansia sp. KLE1798]